MIAILVMLGACSGEPSGHEDEPDEHEGEAGHEERDLELTPEAVKAAAIQVRPAAVGTLGHVVTIPGRIALDPTREGTVSARTPGQVQAIRVKTGDRVTKGTVWSGRSRSRSGSSSSCTSRS